MHDPAVARERAKVTLVHDETLDRFLPVRVAVVEIDLVDGTSLTEASGETVDGFLAHYDADGDLLWVRHLAGSEGNVSGQAVAGDDGGQAVVGGELGGRSSIAGLAPTSVVPARRRPRVRFAAARSRWLTASAAASSSSRIIRSTAIAAWASTPPSTSGSGSACSSPPPPPSASTPARWRPWPAIRLPCASCSRSPRTRRSCSESPSAARIRKSVPTPVVLRANPWLRM